jgi:acetyl-CoA carboxylase biotin carboxyl carrier protein
MASRRGPERDQTSAAVALARQLGQLLRDLDLAEVEARVGDLRVRLQRAVPAAAPITGSPAAPSAPVLPGTGLTATDTSALTLVTVEAPMVGTFYRASSPTAEPYVREGDVVKEGQVLCIIEAMKLMNEIETTMSGRIAKVLVENAQPVEYGQPLFLIEPSR